MLPSQLARKLIDLGICHQYEIAQHGIDILSMLSGQPKKEDFSDIGYNQPDEPTPPKAKSKVVTEKAELLKFDGWVISSSIPKEVPTTTFEGQRYFAYISKGKFYVRGDDVPWAANAIKLIFDIEYILDVNYANNSLVISTIFGQIGLLLK